MFLDFKWKHYTQNDNILHKRIVKRLNLLESKGIDAFAENSIDWEVLNKYDIIVFIFIFWSHRKKFLEIIKNFLDNVLSFEEFEASFSLLFDKIIEENDRCCRDVNFIDTFDPKFTDDRFENDQFEFADNMTSIYRLFEFIEDEFYTEEQIIDYIKEYYITFQSIF